MLRNRLLLLLSALGLLLATFVGYSIYKMAIKGTHAALIPKDTYLAICINLPELGQKIDFKSLEDMELFNEIKSLSGLTSDRDVFSKAVQNPKKSGIKWHSKLFFFFGQNADDVATRGSIFCIADAKKFEKLLKDLDVDNEIQRESGYSYLHLGGDNCVAWNNGIAVTFSATYQESEYLKQEVEKILNTNWNKNKDRTESFEDFASSNGDISYWFDFNANGSNKTSNAISKLQKEMDIESFSQFSTLTFLENAIEFSNHYYVSRDGEELEILNKDGIGDSHLKMVSEKEVFGMIALNLNMESCLNFLYSNEDIKESMETFFKEYGLTKKELKTLFTGEISLSLSGFDELTDTSNNDKRNEALLYSYPNERMLGQYGYEPIYYEYSKPKLPTFVFSASMKNPEVLKTYLEKNRRLPDEEGIYELGDGGRVEWYGVICNQGFMITNSRITALELQQLREFKIPKGEYKSIIQKTPYAAYLAMNPSKYPTPLKAYLEKEMGFKIYNSLVQVMNEFSHMESHSEGNKQVSTIYLNKNSKENSLMRMFKLINTLVEDNTLGNM